MAIRCRQLNKSDKALYTDIRYLGYKGTINILANASIAHIRGHELNSVLSTVSEEVLVVAEIEMQRFSTNDTELSKYLLSRALLAGNTLEQCEFLNVSLLGFDYEGSRVYIYQNTAGLEFVQYLIQLKLGDLYNNPYRVTVSNIINFPKGNKE